MKEHTIKTNFLSCDWKELPEKEQMLVQLAKQMTQHSYSPYSKFSVGAALLLKDGTIVKGSNQENAAYPSGLCAERTALFSANSNYPEQPVVAMAIACYTEGHFLATPGSPCGACRQVMIETEHRYGEPMKIILYGEDRTLVFHSAADLMPLGFFAEDLLG